VAPPTIRSPPGGLQVISKVLVKLNGDIITKSELNRSRRSVTARSIPKF
jgi:hypothetical protein